VLGMTNTINVTDNIIVREVLKKEITLEACSVLTFSIAMACIVLINGAKIQKNISFSKKRNNIY